jgi:TonB-dependent starch-binding outer membrane protein SusC
MRLLILLAWLLSLNAAMAQNLTGTVTDATDGSPLPGVNIVEKGTPNGTNTNADGNFTMSVPANAVLVFSFVGYKSTEVALNGRTNLSVK